MRRRLFGRLFLIDINDILGAFRNFSGLRSGLFVHFLEAVVLDFILCGLVRGAYGHFFQDHFLLDQHLAVLVHVDNGDSAG